MKKITYSSHQSCDNEIDNALMIIMSLDYLANQAVESRLIDVAKVIDETLYSVLAISCSKYREHNFEKKLLNFSERIQESPLHQVNSKKVFLKKSTKVRKHVIKASKA